MVNVESTYTGPSATKKAFTNSATHPLLLDLIMVKKFGPEYLSWEPETCWQEVKLTWGTTVSESCRNKIQAVRTCHVSERPYESWEVFEKVAVGLSGMSPRFDLIQRVTPQSMAVAVDVMTQIKEKRNISEEVYRYIAAGMLDDGFVLGVGPLEPVNKYLASRVGEKLQKEVGRELKSRRPDISVQAMKSLSVKDYVESQSRALLAQLKVIFP